MDTQIELQGRRIEPAEISWLQAWIQEHPDWSRKRIARELCRRWAWVDRQGRLKDFAARSLLLKLEARGWVELPALRVYNRRRPRRAPTWALWMEPSPWEATLAEISPVCLERMTAGSEADRKSTRLNSSHRL